MPLYLIERSFAEQLELTDDVVRLIEDVNADEGVRWLFSFLSADRRRSYCLYEAPVGRGDHGRRPARERSGGRDRRGRPLRAAARRVLERPAHHVSARWRRSDFGSYPIAA